MAFLVYLRGFYGPGGTSYRPGFVIRLNQKSVRKIWRYRKKAVTLQSQSYFFL